MHFCLEQMHLLQCTCSEVERVHAESFSIHFVNTFAQAIVCSSRVSLFRVRRPLSMTTSILRSATSSRVVARTERYLTCAVSNRLADLRVRCECLRVQQAYRRAPCYYSPVAASSTQPPQVYSYPQAAFEISGAVRMATRHLRAGKPFGRMRGTVVLADRQQCDTQRPS